MIRLNVENDNQDLRLDKYLASNQPQHSRSGWQKRIDSGDVLVNDAQVDRSAQLSAGDVVTVTDQQKADNIQLEVPIIFEDDDVVVINKPHGLLVHSVSPSDAELTVVKILKDKLPEDEDNQQRPGVVHRLDRDTSGVMILAKSKNIQQQLQSEFARRKVQKTYVAVLGGEFPHQTAKITVPLGRDMSRPAQYKVDPNGKSAETLLECLDRGRDRTLVELKPKTGRTHQLRVHCAHTGHPIVGDRLYGGEKYQRLLLHARTLLIEINGQTKQFDAPVPEGFEL